MSNQKTHTDTHIDEKQKKSCKCLAKNVVNCEHGIFQFC